MTKSPEAFRTISEVAEWLETPAHVLRFWESKFTQVKPVKRAGGRRYYRPADMALLGGIKKLLHDDGMTIKGVQKMLSEKGVKAVAAMSQPVEPDTEGDAPMIEAEEVREESRVVPFTGRGSEGARGRSGAGAAEAAPAPQTATPEAEATAGEFVEDEARPDDAAEAVAEVEPAETAPQRPDDETENWFVDDAQDQAEEAPVSSPATRSGTDAPREHEPAAGDLVDDARHEAGPPQISVQQDLFARPPAAHVPDFLARPLAARGADPDGSYEIPDEQPLEESASGSGMAAMDSVAEPDPGPATPEPAEAAPEPLPGPLWHLSRLSRLTPDQAARIMPHADRLAQLVGP